MTAQKMSRETIEIWRKAIVKEWGKSDDGHDHFYDAEINELCDLALRGLEEQEQDRLAERGASQSALVDAAHEDRRDNAALPAVVRLPEKVKLPCDCYNGEPMSGCECGNYDDAHSQGYAQGWNDAIDSAMRGSK